MKIHTLIFDLKEISTLPNEDCILGQLVIADMSGRSSMASMSSLEKHSTAINSVEACVSASKDAIAFARLFANLLG